MTHRVTLYTRRGCHLCDEAHAVLRRLRRQAPFDLELVDIEADDALHMRLLERIPVVAVDGEEVSEHFVDAGDLLARLRSDPGAS